MSHRQSRTSGGLAAVRAAIVICFLVLLGRCAWIALVRGPDYAVRAVQQRSMDVVVARVRGQVLDRNMRPLAGAPDKLSPSWPHRAVVVVFPSLVSGQPDALRRLDGLIPGPGVLDGAPRAVSLSQAAYAEVAALAGAVRGIVPLLLPSRYLGLASHVVGDIEISYDWALVAGSSRAGVGSGSLSGNSSGSARATSGAIGTSGAASGSSGEAREVVRVMCDARGREILGLGARMLTLGRPAGWVRLAVDSGLQACAEEALDSRAPGMAGAVVAMDPRTGHVLAMASRPSYNPDDVASVLAKPGAPLVNRAVRPYYPGSIFKVVIAAAALSTGVRSPDSVYTDTGSIEAGGHTFSCYARERGGHGDITFQDALIHSCNTSFIDAAAELGAQTILDFGRALGLGDPDVASAVRLPSSTTGVLPNSRTWTRLGPADLANLALGQSLVQITPLEAAVMMCAVANGGIACRPELVLEACGPDGRRVTRATTAPLADDQSQSQPESQQPPESQSQPESQQPQPGPGQASGKRVLRADVAAALREMLAGVASRGTASAALGGMDVAGKTGTAQTGRVDGSGAPIFNAWFVGFAPVESPRLVVAVLIEGPESGATAAAPIFGDICEYAIGESSGRAR